MDSRILTNGLGQQSILDRTRAMAVLTPEEQDSVEAFAKAGEAIPDALRSKLLSGGAIMTPDEYKQSQQQWLTDNTAGFFGSIGRGLKQTAYGIPAEFGALAEQLGDIGAAAPGPINPIVSSIGQSLRKWAEGKQQQIAALPTDYPRLERGTAIAGDIAKIVAGSKLASLSRVATTGILPGLAAVTGARAASNLEDRGYSGYVAKPLGLAVGAVTGLTGELGVKASEGINSAVRALPYGAGVRTAAASLGEAAVGAPLGVAQGAAQSWLTASPQENPAWAAAGGAIPGAFFGAVRGRSLTAPNATLPAEGLLGMGPGKFQESIQAVLKQSRLQEAQGVPGADAKVAAAEAVAALARTEIAAPAAPANLEALPKAGTPATKATAIQVSEAIHRQPKTMAELAQNLEEAGMDHPTASFFGALGNQVIDYYGKMGPEAPVQTIQEAGAIPKIVKPSTSVEMPDSTTGSGRARELVDENVVGLREALRDRPIQIVRDAKGIWRAGKNGPSAEDFGFAPNKFPPTFFSKTGTARWDDVAQEWGERIPQLQAVGGDSPMTALGNVLSGKLSQKTSRGLSQDADAYYTQQAADAVVNTPTALEYPITETGIKPGDIVYTQGAWRVAQKRALRDPSGTTYDSVELQGPRDSVALTPMEDVSVRGHFPIGDASYALARKELTDSFAVAGAPVPELQPIKSPADQFLDMLRAQQAKPVIEGVVLGKPGDSTDFVDGVLQLRNGATADDALRGLSYVARDLYTTEDLATMTKALGHDVPEAVTREQLRELWTPETFEAHAKGLVQYLDELEHLRTPKNDVLARTATVFRRMFNELAVTDSAGALPDGAKAVFDKLTGGAATIASWVDDPAIASLRPPDVLAVNRLPRVREALRLFTGEALPGELIQRARWLNERATVWDPTDPLLARSLRDGASAMLNRIEDAASTPGLWEQLGFSMPRDAEGRIDLSDPELVRSMALGQAIATGDRAALDELQGKVAFDGQRWTAPSPEFTQAAQGLFAGEAVRRGLPSLGDAKWQEGTTAYLWGLCRNIANAQNAWAERAAQADATLGADQRIGALTQQIAPIAKTLRKAGLNLDKVFRQAGPRLTAQQDAINQYLKLNDDLRSLKVERQRLEQPTKTWQAMGRPVQVQPHDILNRIEVTPLSPEGMAALLAEAHGGRAPAGTDVRGFWQTKRGQKQEMLGGTIALLSQTDPNKPLDGMRYTALHELMHGTIQFTRGTELGVILEDWARLRYPKMRDFWTHRQAQEEAAVALAAYPVTGHIPEGFKGTSAENLVKVLGQRMLEDFQGAQIVASQTNPSALKWYKPWTWAAPANPMERESEIRQQSFRQLAGRIGENQAALDMVEHLFHFKPHEWVVMPDEAPPVSQTPPVAPVVPPPAPTTPADATPPALEMAPAARTGEVPPPLRPTEPVGPKAPPGAAEGESGPAYRIGSGGKAIEEKPHIGVTGERRLEEIWSPEVAASLKLAQEVVPGAFTERKYTWAEIDQAGRQIAEDPVAFRKQVKALEDNPDLIPGAVLGDALDKHLAAYVGDVSAQLSKALDAGDLELATSLGNLLETRVKSPAVQAALKAKSQAGLALNLAKKGVPTVMLRHLQRVFYRATIDANKWRRTNKPLDADRLKAYSTALRLINDGNVQQNMDLFLQQLQAIKVPPLRDQLISHNANMLLSGLRPLVQNPLTNWLHRESHGPAYLVASGMDAAAEALFKIAGKPYERTYYAKPALNFMAGMFSLKDARELWTAGGKGLLKGVEVFDPRDTDITLDRFAAERYNRFKALENSQFEFVRRYAPIMSIFMRIQRAQDFMQGNAGYHRELRFRTYVDAIKAHIANPAKSTTDYMDSFLAENAALYKTNLAKLTGPPTPAQLRVLRAQSFGRYVVFMSDPGPLLQQLMALRNTGSVMDFALQLAQPFMLTGANIAKRGLELNPFMPLAKALIGGYEASRGKTPPDWAGPSNPTGREVAKTYATDPALWAKAAMGAGFMIAAKVAFDNGSLTAGPYTNSVAEDARRARGIPNWSFRIPGTDRWMPYKWLGPFAVPIGLSATVFQAMEESRSHSPEQVAQGANYTQVLRDVTQFLSDLLPIQGVVSGTLGSGSLLAETGRLLTNMVPFPQLLRDLNRLAEQSVSDGRPIRTRNLKGRSAFEKFTSGAIPVVPGAPFWGKNYMAPIKLNVWGDEVRIPENLLSAWFQLPLVHEQTSRVDAELGRLQKKTGMLWYPQPPQPDRTTARFGKVTLPDDLYMEAILKTGKEIRRAVTELIGSDSYRNAPSAEVQLHRIDTCIKRTREPIMEKAFTEQIARERAQGARPAGKPVTPEAPAWLR